MPWVLPAYERLNTKQFPRPDRHLRLEVKHKLSALDSAIQFTEELEASTHGALDVLVVDLESILSIGLCGVHREICSAQQLAAFLAVRCERDAHAGVSE